MATASFKTVLGSPPLLGLFATRACYGTFQGLLSPPSTTQKVNSLFTKQSFLTDYRRRHYPLLQPPSLFGRTLKREFTTQIEDPLSNTQIAKKQIDGASEAVMSQEEFAKRHRLSFDDFVEKYGDLVEKKGLNPQKAYQRMIKCSYENYLYHKKIINPGRIC